MRSEFNFYSFDNTKLNMVSDSVAKPKGIVIIIHGLCEHLGRYEYIANKLNEAGYSTYRYDHRGHGCSEGKRTFFSTYTEISDDLNAVVNFVKRENPDSKLFILGHSMGGHASACFGTRYPGKVNGIILTGALIRQNNAPDGSFPIRLPDDYYLENKFTEVICSDSEVRKKYLNDPLVEKKIAVGLLNRCWEGVQFLKENGKAFKDPVLVLHGCCDTIVSEKDSRDFFGDISSEDKTLKIYPCLFHEILNEPCKDKIIAEIVFWLDEHEK